MLSNKKILVLSTSSLTCHFFEEFEESMDNCQVKIAENFEKLQQLMIYFRFDLFIIDEKSIGIEPEKATQYIKEHPDHVFTPILMVSGNLKKSFVRQMLQIGVTDFLTEPLENEECLLRIEMSMQSMQKNQKMQHLLPSKLLPSDQQASPIKSVQVVSSSLKEAITRCIKEESTLGLLHIEIQGSVENTSINKLLQRQMRHQDILIMKKSHCFLAILEHTTFRAATFIGENLFETLSLFIKKHKLEITFGIGGSFLEGSCFGQKEADIVLNLEKIAFDGAKASLNNKKMVINKLA